MRPTRGPSTQGETMLWNRHRLPKGTSAGGQFAARYRDEDDLTLPSPASEGYDWEALLDAGDMRTRPDRLAELATSAHVGVRQVLATNSSCLPEILQLLSFDEALSV